LAGSALELANVRRTWTVIFRYEELSPPSRIST
jgi:hypothetical protein